MDVQDSETELHGRIQAGSGSAGGSGRQKIAASGTRLGIAEQTLSNWRKMAKAGKLAAGKPVTPEQMELSRLKAENARLKMEVEILKKRRRTSRGNRCEVCLNRQSTRFLSVTGTVRDAGCVDRRLRRVEEMRRPNALAFG